MTTELMTQLGYVVAAGLFIFGLKMLGSPATARRGNMVSAYTLSLHDALPIYRKSVV